MCRFLRPKMLKQSDFPILTASYLGAFPSFCRDFLSKMLKMLHQSQFVTQLGLSTRYPYAKRQIFVTKVEAICIIFGRFVPSFRADFFVQKSWNRVTSPSKLRHIWELFPKFAEIFSSKKVENFAPRIFSTFLDAKLLNYYAYGIFNFFGRKNIKFRHQYRRY